MKDNFSKQSAHYVKFRPTYPKALYDFLKKIVPQHDKAWDCGTGNGQVAQELSTFFTEVIATDISENQLANANQKDNITYLISPAEKTPFNDHSFNLITVAQAIHWFDFNAFYKEVKRTGKPDGVLAVIGYGSIQIDERITPILQKFHYQILGNYWDEERKYLDESYRNIPFPFDEIKVPELYIEDDWTLEQLIGYLKTWSSVQHYIKANGTNPVDLIYDSIVTEWGNSVTKKIKFPLLLRIGKINH